jgi:hypothetical protein
MQATGHTIAAFRLLLTYNVAPFRYLYLHFYKSTGMPDGDLENDIIKPLSGLAGTGTRGSHNEAELLDADGSET